MRRTMLWAVRRTVHFRKHNEKLESYDSRYVTMLQRVWTSHVQVLRGRVRPKNCEKTWKRHGASGTRTVGAVRYSGGVFRVAATSASSSSKNFVVPSVRASPLNTDNPWWRGSRDSRVQSRNWTFHALVARTRVATNDLLSGERSMPHSRVVYWQVRW